MSSFGARWRKTDPGGARPERDVAAVGCPGGGRAAIPVDDPTLARHGRQSPDHDPAILPNRDAPFYSVADSLARARAVRPRVRDAEVLQSRTCGPVVDVVDRVARFTGTRVRFIHVEIYEGNNPPKRFNRGSGVEAADRAVVFLVGRDGEIKAKFEGSLSVARAATAAVEHLVRRLPR